MQALQPLQVQIKGNSLKGFYDTGAEITCVPAIFLIEEEPIGERTIQTIHGITKEKVYYLTFKIQGRKLAAEVIGTQLDYVIIAPSDIPWYKKYELELTIKIDIQKQQEQLLHTTNLSSEGKKYLKDLFIKYDNLWQKWENQVGHRRITPHKIATGTLNPKPQKQYRINPKAKADIQIVINDLLKQGVLKQQTSPMNTPVYPVPKPDGRWRMVLDYRAVNKVTPAIATQNCHSASLLNTLYRGQYKTTLDLANGFWAHPIQESDQWITSFTWNGKSYVWTTLPQGFLNSPALFTADVVDLLKDIPNVEVYVDDVYFSNDTEEEHLKTMDLLFQKLQTAGYIVSLKKSKIGQHTVDFLGFQITQTGRGLTDSYKSKLLDITPPNTLKQLQSILGLLNFARNFIPNYSELITPLYQLIPLAKGIYIPWETKHTAILQKIIKELNASENLEQRKPDVELIVKVHVSPTAGYIKFANKGSIKPIAYHNVVFSKTELKFTITEKVMTTIHKALLKAFDLAMGQPIWVYSPIHSMTRIQKTPLTERKALSIRWLKWQTYFEDPRLIFHYDDTLPDLQNLPQTTLGNEVDILPLSEYEVVFYTDGSSIKSPKKDKQHSAGMGIIAVKYQPQMNIIQEWSIPLGDHTAQFAEIAAFEFALKQAIRKMGPVLIVTDSDYVARSYNQELDFWVSNGFVNNKKKPLKHVSKWKSIADCKKHKADIHVIHEPGHQNDLQSPYAMGNNAADKLAVKASYTVFSVQTLPSLDAELHQLLDKQTPNPKGYPSKYEYTLRDGQVYVKRTDGEKIIPSKDDRVKILELAHKGPGSGHLGKNTMYIKILNKYWWPNLIKDISKYIRACTNCIITNTDNAPNKSYIIQEKTGLPFQKYYMDYIGPLPPSDGYYHVLVIVDEGTGYTWLYPTKAQTANATVKALNHLTGTAIPKVLHSDQGSAFTSATLVDWAKDKGIQMEYSSPYHPQSSGKVERKNSEIKRLLTKLLVGRPTKWYPLIPTVQLALNNTPNAKIGKTPHQLMYGVDCNLPFQDLSTLDLTREEQLAVLQEIRTALEQPAQHPTLPKWTPCPGLLVQERVNRPAQLRPKWKKPTPILKVLNPKTVVIAGPGGQERIVSIDNLKKTPHHDTSNDSTRMDAVEVPTECQHDQGGHT
uniref:Pro-Pol polyprotein n=1 Tax=Equine foamy virus TaxID=109270 RepID=A0A510DPD3_9RETR|nr:Pol [Equine foamy virus]